MLHITSSNNINPLPAFLTLPDGGRIEIGHDTVCGLCGVPIRCSDASESATFGGLLIICRNGHTFLNYGPSR